VGKYDVGTGFHTSVCIAIHYQHKCNNRRIVFIACWLGLLEGADHTSASEMLQHISLVGSVASSGDSLCCVAGGNILPS
jgi:hypothetical protein